MLFNCSRKKHVALKSLIMYVSQVADQSGRSLELPAAERKALIIAMSLHEKGRAALHSGDYSLGNDNTD